MSQDTPNPFLFPGMNAAFGSASSNPLLTSMDMMRQAATNMGYGGASGEPAANPMAPKELEKRIGELRVVENWLKLNLSMLSSTIQGMEVQLATVKTLQSFVAMGQDSQTDDPLTPSPLEIALGLKPAPNKPKQAPETKTQKAASPTSRASEQKDMQQAAAENWWNMLEGQFAQMAAATTNATQMTNDALAKSPFTAKSSQAARKTKANTAKKTTKSTKAAKSRSN
jgi:hypothetical protein